MEGKKKNNGEMSFWGHLEALRWTFFRMLIAMAMLVVAAFLAMPYIFDRFILAPTTSGFFLYKFFARLCGSLSFLPDFGDPDFTVNLININVASQFMTHISTSLYIALVAAFPYLIYEIWKFIRPALYPQEKKNIRKAFIFGTAMFFLGCAVGYFIVFPFTFRFLVEYKVSSQIVNQINLNSYMGIFVTMIFIMGVVFELPMLAWILSKLGIVSREMLVKYRKYAIVVLLILAAVITPTGDPVTLMIVFLPVYMLYELSVLLVRPAKISRKQQSRSGTILALTPEQVEQMRIEAKAWLPARTQMLAERYDFSFHRITIKNNVSNWGSCSTLGNINLNLRLMALPEPLRDYTILHELSHLRQCNHGRQFHEGLENLCRTHLSSTRYADMRDEEFRIETLSLSARSKALFPVSHLLEKAMKGYHLR